MSTRSPLAPAAGLALLVLTMAVAPVAAHAPTSAPSTHARTVEFWTPERMASAVPVAAKRVDLVPTARTAKGKPSAPGSRDAGTPVAVAGASWNGGGPVRDLTGKVYFTIGASAYICSGSVIADAGRAGYSLVLTAGHCAFDLTSAAFFTNWMFIPNFDASPSYTCADTRYGCWTADALVIHYGFRHAGAFNG